MGKYCLGIESSADDFGVGIAAFSGEILANKSDSYIPTEGGIHPREAARHHAEVADVVLQEALTKAGIKASRVNLHRFLSRTRTRTLPAHRSNRRPSISLIPQNPTRRRQPLRRPHRNRQTPNRRQRPRHPLRFRRQHHGHRLRIRPIPRVRRNTRHRLRQLLDVFGREAGLKTQEGVADWSSHRTAWHLRVKSWFLCPMWLRVWICRLAAY